ncbi:MAG: S4 domain-containing protein, partial [Lutispora sp.]
VPTTEIDKDQLKDGINIIDLLILTGLVPSKGEGRRLINQGGLVVNDEKVESIDLQITLEDFKEEGLMMKKGKKTYHRVIIIA